MVVQWDVPRDRGKSRFPARNSEGFAASLKCCNMTIPSSAAVEDALIELGHVEVKNEYRYIDKL